MKIETVNERATLEWVNLAQLQIAFHYESSFYGSCRLSCRIKRVNSSLRIDPKTVMIEERHLLRGGEANLCRIATDCLNRLLIQNTRKILNEFEQSRKVESRRTNGGWPVFRWIKPDRISALIFGTKEF
ncbi:MAG TPA: hypothetical protein VMN76_11085 [Acidobacteriota bacterium]|nr:hypothetical protein [Acidobacteriota bacterium]